MPRPTRRANRKAGPASNTRKRKLNISEKEEDLSSSNKRSNLMQDSPSNNINNNNSFPDTLSTTTTTTISETMVGTPKRGRGGIIRQSHRNQPPSVSDDSQQAGTSGEATASDTEEGPVTEFKNSEIVDFLEYVFKVEDGCTIHEDWKDFRYAHNRWKDFRYVALDLPKLYREVRRKYAGLGSDLLKDLRLLCSLTFVRGYSLDKVTKNIHNQAKEQDIRNAIGRLGVVRRPNPGSSDLTLRTVTQLMPVAHPEFLHKKCNIHRRRFLRQIPLEANCETFTSCVPTDKRFDALFWCGVLYNIFWDTVTTASQTGSKVRVIVSFNRDLRDGGVLSEAVKLKFIKWWKLDSDAALTRFSWIEPMIRMTMDMNSKAAWQIYSGRLASEPEYITDAILSAPYRRPGKD